MHYVPSRIDNNQVYAEPKLTIVTPEYKIAAAIPDMKQVEDWFLGHGKYELGVGRLSEPMMKLAYKIVDHVEEQGLWVYQSEFPSKPKGLLD